MFPKDVSLFKGPGRDSLVSEGRQIEKNLGFHLARLSVIYGKTPCLQLQKFNIVGELSHKEVTLGSTYFSYPEDMAGGGVRPVHVSTTHRQLHGIILPTCKV